MVVQLYAYHLNQMTTQIAGKQPNSIFDKTDGNNPRTPNFLFYFSIVVVWGFVSPASFLAGS